MAPRGVGVRYDLCSGCRACQVACVARHEGRFGVSAARLRVVKNEPLGLDNPQVCHLCGKAPCLAACPAGALTRDSITGAIVLGADACDRCLACVKACPFGMVAVHRETGLPLICDLCGGEPACVLRCPTGALYYPDLPTARAWPPARDLVRPGPI
jgi:carbon-monoxide dehydrogenase iron sulfur subunit